MEKYDKFFLDKCPCSKTSMLVIFSIYMHYQGNLVKEKLASVYSRQVFLDKWGCQGKLACVNEALITKYMQMRLFFFYPAEY